MADTAVVALTKDVWTLVSAPFTRGLLTNGTDHDMRYRESASAPDDDNNEGHILVPGETVSFSLLPTATLYARGTVTNGQAVVTVGDAFTGSDLRNFILEVTKGNVPGHSILSVEGFAVVAVAIVPIANSLTYNTPVAPVALEVLSDSADDSPSGLGGHEISMTYINTDWDKVTATRPLAGVTPVALPADVLRLLEWSVSVSGTYGNPFAASYVGNLTIRETATPLNIWSVIDNTPPFAGISEIGVTTIPRRKRGYLISKHIAVDAGKTANVYLLSRDNADDLVTPFTGVRKMVERDIGLQAHASIVFEGLKGPFQGPCDIGFIGHAVGQDASIAIEMDLLIVDDGY